MIEKQSSAIDFSEGVRTLWDAAAVPYAKATVLLGTIWGNVLLFLMCVATGAGMPYALIFICGFALVLALSRSKSAKPIKRWNVAELGALGFSLIGVFLAVMIVWQAAHVWSPSQGDLLGVLFVPIALAPQAMFWIWWEFVSAPIFDSRNFENKDKGAPHE